MFPVKLLDRAGRVLKVGIDVRLMNDVKVLENYLQLSASVNYHPWMKLLCGSTGRVCQMDEIQNIVEVQFRELSGEAEAALAQSGWMRSCWFPGGVLDSVEENDENARHKYHLDSVTAGDFILAFQLKPLCDPESTDDEGHTSMLQSCEMEDDCSESSPRTPGSQSSISQYISDMDLDQDIYCHTCLEWFHGSTAWRVHKIGKRHKEATRHKYHLDSFTGGDFLLAFQLKPLCDAESTDDEDYTTMLRSCEKEDDCEECVCDLSDNNTVSAAA